MAEYITPDADADVTMGEVSGAAPPGEVVTAASSPSRLAPDAAREITYAAHSRHLMTCEIFGKELAGIIPTDADGRDKLIERAVKRFDDGDHHNAACDSIGCCCPLAEFLEKERPSVECIVQHMQGHAEDPLYDGGKHAKVSMPQA